MNKILLILMLSSPNPEGGVAGEIPKPEPSSEEKLEVPTQDIISKVENLSKLGSDEYRNQNFKESLNYFQEAYNLIPEPNLLYNIGRCHENLGDIDKARALYEKMVSDPNTDPAVAAKGRQRIVLLKPVETAPATIPTIITPQSLPTEAIKSSSESPSNQTDLTVPAWLSSGLGAALLVGGVVTYGLGYGDHQDIENSKSSTTPSSMTRVKAIDLKDSGESKKIIGGGLMISGAVVGCIGGLLFYLNENKSPSTEASIQINADSHGINLGFGGNF